MNLRNYPRALIRTGERDRVQCPCPKCHDGRESNSVRAVRRYCDMGAEFLGFEVETRREYDLQCDACGHVHTLIVEVKP